MGIGGVAFTPFSLFLDGPSGIDKIVSASGSVVKTSYGIDIASNGLGTLKVFVSQEGTKPVITKIHVDNKAMKLAEYRLFPMFSDRPDRPLDEYVVHSTSKAKFSKHTFKTELSKGIPIEDHRK